MAEHSYVVVTNIPKEYHAADLRAHFSSLVESKSFKCFHFRHRPEKQEANAVQDLNSQSSEGSVQSVGKKIQGRSKRCCCVVKVVKSKLQSMLRYDGTYWVGCNGETSQITCSVSSIALADGPPTENGADAVEEEKLTQMPELNPPAKMPNGNIGTPTLVFLDMIQQCLLPQTFVKKLQLKFPKTQGKRLYGHMNFDYGTSDNDNDDQLKEKTTSSRLSPDIQLKSLSEKRRLKLSMTKRTEHCEEPSCDKTVPLCENQPSTETSSVEGDSASNCAQTNDSTQKLTPSQGTCSSDNKDIPEQPSSHSSSESIETPGCDDSLIFKEPASGREVVLSTRERKRREKADRRETQKLMDEGIEERLIAIERKYHNDEDAEQWDLHEASEDDPSNQERNTERLYEQEEEQPWEKGGPGIVWYTDAAFWQAREGDFDEKTTDDLDVDFSPYEEDGAGDKDIKDFLKIRQEQRFRSGYDNTDRFSIGIARRREASDKQGVKLPSSSSQHQGSTDTNQKRPANIGKFEQFSKGVGRRVMESQGWREGQGLGRSGVGMKDALRGEGKRPHDKQGLGYSRPPVPLYQATVAAAGPSQTGRKRGPDLPLISTVYDHPSTTDPKVPMLQRAEPTALKYRQSYLDKFSPS